MDLLQEMVLIQPWTPFTKRLSRLEYKFVKQFLRDRNISTLLLTGFNEEATANISNPL